MGSRLLTALMLLCGALDPTMEALGAEKPAELFPKKTFPDSATSDLLDLSLEELYNLDIIQMNALGAHTHPAGEMMFGYRYMFMSMDGIWNGDNKITPKEVFALHPEYTVAHVRMEMEEHMFNVMYAPSDRVTLMAMIPYKRMSMLHVQPNNDEFTQKADGFGDLQLMGMITVLRSCKKKECNRLILNVGVSLPTGSIHVRDHAEGDSEKGLVKLEYPMQLGSGTFDLLPGLTYLGEANNFAWGVQVMGTIRTGRNSSGYRLGNQYESSAWVAYGVTDWLAPYVRMEGRVWENISGRDSAYGDVPKSAEASPDLQAGERVNALVGLNLYAGKGVLQGNRITVEAGVPVYQHLRGPQLGLDWTINVGWTYGF